MSPEELVWSVFENRWVTQAYWDYINGTGPLTVAVMDDEAAGNR